MKFFTQFVSQKIATVAPIAAAAAWTTAGGYIAGRGIQEDIRRAEAYSVHGEIAPTQPVGSMGFYTPRRDPVTTNTVSTQFTSPSMS